MQSWVTAKRLRSIRDFDGLKYQLEEFKQRFPNSGWANSMFGQLYGMHGQHELALKHLKLAVKQSSKEFEVVYNLSVAYFMMRNPKKSVKWLRFLLSKKSGKPNKEEEFRIRFFLGASYAILEEYKKALLQLERCLDLQPSKYLSNIYLDVYDSQNTGSKLTSEFITALKNNKVSWNYSIIYELPLTLERLDVVILALDKLLSKNHKKLSARSSNANQLAVAFFHYINATAELLNKNRTFAAYSLARSSFEAYIKTAYGLMSYSNRNFATLEFEALTRKKKANERIIKRNLHEDIDIHQYIAANKKIGKKLKSLSKRYVSISENIPSYSEMIRASDELRGTEIYDYYIHLHEVGSEALHLNSSSLARFSKLSGDKTLGVITDTYDLAELIRYLTEAFGELYCELPELTQIARKEFSKSLKDL